MDDANYPLEQIKPVKPYFRDMLQTVDETGRRRWIYPKRPTGNLFRVRSIVAGILLLFFFAVPFISYKGEPLVLLSFLDRKILIFGQVFWPQDFHLLGLSIIVLIVFLILFTVKFGRVFCGWSCPQTIFMEFVFRQIEYLVEGDSGKQTELDRQAMDLEKFMKKGIKHFIFLFISFLVINTTFAWFIGADRLGLLLSEGPVAHAGIFSVVFIFTIVFYLVYAFFREQVCVLVCPYGRLQGVLLDENSVVVAYDYKRGEPRHTSARSKKRTETGNGHCIDCRNCVSVCPTGIDIRNGTQLECINCTACIDACNRVMDRIKLPRGLVRYDSEVGISTGVRNLFNPRTVAYTAILAVLLVVTGALFVTREDMEATVFRMPGTQFQQYGPSGFTNIYKVQLINKTRSDLPVEMRIISHAGEILYIGSELSAPRDRPGEATFMVVLDQKLLESSNTPIAIGIISGGKQVTVCKTNFLGPGFLDKQ